MNTVLPVVVTNGRWEYLREAMESYTFGFDFDFDRVKLSWEGPVLVYDGNDDIPADILRWFPRVEHPRGTGFDAAVRAVFSAVKSSSDDVTHVLHLEDDFLLNEQVSVADMVDTLELMPELAQVALQRQPVNEGEFLAGGVIAQWPELWEQVGLSIEPPWPGVRERRQWNVSTQELFFTTNPSVYRRSLAEEPWPHGAGSEARFTGHLLELGFRFAYLGGKKDPPLVHHIGVSRTGSVY